MLDRYDPKVLLALWNKGTITLREAFKRMLENQVRLYRRQNLNDDRLIMQQQEIERLDLIIPKLEDRIRVLEQKPDINGSSKKGNGTMT